MLNVKDAMKSHSMQVYFGLRDSCQDSRYSVTVTDRVSREGNAIGGVRLSVRPFVSSLSFEPTDL